MENIPEASKVSPFLVYYTILSSQIGVGILSFQRHIAEAAGNDAWISIILSGIFIHIILFLIYKILEMSNGDLFDAQKMIFGQKLSALISSFFIIFYGVVGLAVLRTFYKIVEVWMFPDLKTFWIVLLTLLLINYIIYGGFRTVTGFCFFGTMIPIFLLFSFFFAIQFGEFRNLLPILNHSIIDILKGSYNMSLSIIGFEMILLYYPLIKNPQQSKKWAHLGIMTTIIIYLFLGLIALTYFSDLQLKNTIWATLSMWKVVQFPFIERFEYIGIAVWGLVILPNICLSFWCASRAMKRVYHVRMRTGIVLLSSVCLAITPFIKTMKQINTLNEWIAKIGFIYIFIYIPFIFLALFIVKKVKKT